MLAAWLALLPADAIVLVPADLGKEIDIGFRQFSPRRQTEEP